MESNDCVNLSVRKKSLELKNKNDDGIIKHHGNQKLEKRLILPVVHISVMELMSVVLIQYK